MTNLLARLNTHESLNAATSEEKVYGAGIYVDFSDESELYKQGTFKKIIDAMLEQAIESSEPSYKAIANAVKNSIAHRGPATRCDISIYNPQRGQYLRNVNNEESVVMKLDDSIKDYIVEREITDNEGITTKVDYLDIVVKLNSSVGGL